MSNIIKKYIYRLLHPSIGEVWQLHRITTIISPDEKDRLYEITPYRLENLIQVYLSKGYHFISISQLHDMIETGKYGKHFVAVTIDDGYKNNFDIAYPIFQKYNIPFCIYITKDYIQKGHYNYQFLTEEQLVSLAKEPLCTLGCHTCSHPRLSMLSKENQINELAFCKQWLEQIIKQPVIHAAYPYGDYSATTIQIAKSLEFASVVAAWGGKIKKNEKYSLYSIPRVLVTETDIQ